MRQQTGGKSTDWRVHGGFDLGSGGFSHLKLTDKHDPGALECSAPLAGEIRIGDRNYARVAVLKRFLAESGGKADFIVWVGWNALRLSIPRGKPCDLIGYLQRFPAGMWPHKMIFRAAAERGAAPDLLLNNKLGLRGSAVSLSRKGHKARRKLVQLQRTRANAPPQPTKHPPDKAATHQALGLIGFARGAN